MLAWTATFALLTMVAEASSAGYTRYTTITGFFLQDEPTTVAVTFNYATSNFGLIDRPYDTDGEYDPDHKKTQWQRFEHQVFRLNRESGRKVQYKVLFMGRHGEGFHNVAESFYGTPAWDCYWSKLDGNGTIEWSDANITTNGANQAIIANNFWKREIAEQKIPVPEKYYSSPLTRCLETAHITFSSLTLPDHRPFAPLIKEKMRETIGIHTCDRRRSKTYIKATYPEFSFEDGFTETDELWKPDLRETNSLEDVRFRELLDDIFSHDDSTYLSFTAHSGAIASILRVIGHRDFSLSTGAVIPVLVKAEDVDAPAPRPTLEPSTSAPACTANPTSTAV
ncbi:MAG: hypothetical protein M1829_002324 [Trizodia sp. TS-e1964]|nr:MAG: hypothetical protein M1829_002324 [Trizodia sp. TS-e1964]